ncbi:MAG: hypothetical protein K0Q77_1527 [Anaerosporomusa subterranea]|jgi:predicted TIM-barrel enzyme|nr:hypothetical protein [Anaerosporomusa subterranea]
MLTSPYVFNDEDAKKMTRAGADLLVAHMGLTTKGTIGAKTALTLDDCVNRIQSMHDAAKTINSHIMVICHGGPIAEPADAHTSWPIPKALWVSTAPPAWNAYRPKKLLPHR